MASYCGYRPFLAAVGVQSYTHLSIIVLLRVNNNCMILERFVGEWNDETSDFSRFQFNIRRRQQKWGLCVWSNIHSIKHTYSIEQQSTSSQWLRSHSLLARRNGEPNRGQLSYYVARRRRSTHRSVSNWNLVAGGFGKMLMSVKRWSRRKHESDNNRSAIQQQ